jgi:uncharacterized protein (TIGR02145 family)
MKNNIFTLILLVVVSGLMAQAPMSFNYQAMLRNEAGEPMVNENVSIQLEILQGEIREDKNNVVFTETHATSTGDLGLVNLKVGSIESMEDIQWGDGPFFIRISVNGTEMGTSQLLSVPFAMHAMSSSDAFSGDYNDLENTPDLSNFIEVAAPVAGDLLLFVGESWQTLPVGEEGQILQIVDGLPQWATIEFDDDNGDDGDEGTFVDPRDGQEYSWVKIGNQRWMAENLNFYTPGGSWYYDNDSVQYAASYGRLYVWPVAMDGAASSNENPSGVQGVCPPGWHIPSDVEWQQLIDFLDSETPANLLKETGTDHWQSTNENVTNETGFTARAGGRRQSNGTFQSILSFGLWWSSKERLDSPDNAWTRYMLHNSANVTRFSSAKNVAISVRCVKD